MAVVVAGVGLVVAVWVGSPAVAGAHAELVSSQPPAGGTLAPPPARLTLRFTEAVDLTRSSVALVRPDGAIVALTGPAHPGSDQTALSFEAPRVSAGGAVSVEWRSVSADDGHPAAGRFSLNLATQIAPISTGPGSGGPDGGARQPPDTAGVAAVFAATRSLSYLSIALLCGGLVFLAMIWPEGAAVRRSRTVLYGAWLGGMASAVLGLGLEGATTAQKPLAAMFSPACWELF
jgi:copper transport protein